MIARRAYVVSLGASTPVGIDAQTSAAAVRAGVSALAEHPFMIDTVGEPMKVALAPWLDIGMGVSARIEALLFAALDQALLPLADKLDLKVGLSLGLSHLRPGLPADLEGGLRAAIAQRYRGQFAAAAVFTCGHAAGLLALSAALTKLEQGAFDACLVTGADSYIEPESLEWLEQSDQLHGAGPLNNAWGFIPGEAAGAVCLMSERVVHDLRLQPLACVLGIGTALEAKRIKTETVCIGEGLTQAFRQALLALPNEDKVTDVYCDMNGEPYRADEYGFTCLRTKEAFESASDFVAPADCWGDVAAASAPLYIALAAIAGSKGYAKGRSALAWASSESGERGAVLLRVGEGN